MTSSINVREEIVANRCVIDIETEDLHPTQGRIVCIGIMDVKIGTTIVFFDEDEEQMLRDFVEYYYRRGFDEIIGYNVLFDIRYIFARLLKYEINSKGLFRSTYTDLMGIMKSVKNIWSMNRPGTLQEWSEFLFGDGNGKVKLSSSVADMYRAGMIDEITEYNKRDIELTYNIWKKVQHVMG